MLLFRVALLSLSSLVVISIVACSGKEPTPTPTPVIRTVSENINLYDKSSGQSSILADAGDRVNVAIEVRQLNDEYARCGRPSIRDSFGNVIANLNPTMRKQNSNISWTYQYTFFTAEKGTYMVELENRECNIRGTRSEADVTWTVYTAPQR